MRIPILVYHYFGSSRHVQAGIKEEDADFITPIELFRDHLSYLKDAGFVAISFELLLAARRGEQTLPEKPFILTIDDSHRSVAEGAAPALKKFRWPAELFVIPARIDEPGYLQWQDLRDLGALDIASQSHALTHRLLNRLSKDEIEREMVESKRVIEDHTGVAVRALAVPMGGYPGSTRRIAIAAGYQIVCTSYYGVADPAGDLFYLPRIMMRAPYDSVPQLAALIEQRLSLALPLRVRNLAKSLKNRLIGLSSV
jgi:peptidoglycan/xylan/chitin deacetylase (PgdA/CDA1 family)